MRQARDIMTPNPVTISPKASIAEAVKVLLEKKFNGLPVVDDAGRLVGVICQSDLVAQQQRLHVPSVFTLLDGFIPLPGWSKAEEAFKKMSALVVEEAMTPKPVTAAPDMPLEDLASLMVKAKYYSLPVVEDGRLVGIIGKEDILRTLVEQEP
ncbi:CBS domain containing membrane protein [uncultured delta proteobacterium]|uniref:CBS domain containing membrane protein n=1 Tax=uncultured delta proteobacterium TaxID=34034 RepID=A0A212JE07_9DELT|nr:CBS domain containing membrane protein [uncultured delta proteobacterium]